MKEEMQSSGYEMAESDESQKGGSSIDNTLDEIKKLRVIDRELAKTTGKQGQKKSDKEGVNEDMIEA